MPSHAFLDRLLDVLNVTLIVLSLPIPRVLDRRIDLTGLDFVLVTVCQSPGLDEMIGLERLEGSVALKAREEGRPFNRLVSVAQSSCSARAASAAYAASVFADVAAKSCVISKSRLRLRDTRSCGLRF